MNKNMTDCGNPTGKVCHGGCVKCRVMRCDGSTWVTKEEMDTTEMVKGPDVEEVECRAKDSVLNLQGSTEANAAFGLGS